MDVSRHILYVLEDAIQSMYFKRSEKVGEDAFVRGASVLSMIIHHPINQTFIHHSKIFPVAVRHPLSSHF